MEKRSINWTSNFIQIVWQQEHIYEAMVQSLEKRTMPKDVESDKYQPHMCEITSTISGAKSSRDSQGQLPF